MSVEAYFPKPAVPVKVTTREADARLDRFGIVLPVIMAVLLTLLPIVGKAVAPIFALVLLPLVIWTAVTNTERAIYVYCAWCWMDGTIRGLFEYNAIAVVSRDIVLAIITVCWLWRRLGRQSVDPLRLPPLTLLIAMFAINCLLQIGNPYSLGILPSLAGLKTHLSTIPIFFLAYDVFRRRAQVRTLFMFLTLATLVISVVSVVQYQQGRDWTYAHYPGTKLTISQSFNTTTVFTKKDATFKPPGTTTFGGGTGAFVSMILPLTFVLLLLVSKLRFGNLAKSALVGAVFLFVVALLLNGVRSALVNGMLGILLCILLVGGRLRIRVIGAVLACLLLGLIGLALSVNISGGGVLDRYASLFANPAQALHQDRTTFFQDFEYLVTNAPMGVGMGRVGAAGMLASQLASDTSALRFNIFSESYLGDMIAETGIIGALLIASITGGILWRGYRLVQSTSNINDRLMSAALLAVLIIMFVNFFVSSVILGLPGSVVFWLFAAVLLRVYETRTVEERPILATHAG